MRLHLIFLLITGTCLWLPVASQQYSEIFGTDYTAAVETVQTHSWWADTLQKDGIDARFALSVIFPELIRYSAISDYIEVKALEVLYVQYGRDYADFSIGLFQMKPSFAEKIEADILNSHLTNQFPRLSALKTDTTEAPAARNARIARLKEGSGQLLYLEAFIRIMEQLYPDIAKLPVKEKLIFYATAYNAGYWRGEKVIKRESDKAYFHCEMFEPAKKYTYAGIALEYYLSGQ